MQNNLHKILIRYRILYIIITFFFIYLAWDAWEWFKLNHTFLSEASSAGFISIYLAVIGALKYVVENCKCDDKQD